MRCLLDGLFFHCATDVDDVVGDDAQPDPTLHSGKPFRPCCGLRRLRPASLPPPDLTACWARSWASDFLPRYIIPNELTAAAAALALLRAGTIGPEAGWEAALWAAGSGLLIALPFLALMAGYRWWRGRDGLSYFSAQN